MRLLFLLVSFYAMISSFHGMIPSFHAVFGLRHRGKSAKVIDYNDQVIWVREYLLLLGIPHVFSTEGSSGSAKISGGSDLYVSLISLFSYPE